MIELKDDLFYQEIKKYSDCCVEYHIIKSSTPYENEKSHREVVSFVLEQEEYSYDIEKAKFHLISSSDLFSSNDNQFTYWKAFFEPPFGNQYVYDEAGNIIRRNVTLSDFQTINQLLFPNGYSHIDIYEWSTDWSEYFDEGNEWWGAGCWSIYDYDLDRFVIIMASATD